MASPEGHPQAMKAKKASLPGYELIDTTADLGFIARGADLIELFKNAFAAIDTLLFPDRKIMTFHQMNSREMSLNSQSPEVLLIDFLNALLFHIYTESVMIIGIDIQAITPTTLNMRMDTSPWTSPPQLEIKAATHHLLQITKKNTLLEARVYLDI